MLLEAHAATTRDSSQLIGPVKDPARLEVLERLLLDVRAGRVKEFRLDGNDKVHIAIDD